jgi:hypothetical protein
MPVRLLAVGAVVAATLVVPAFAGQRVPSTVEIDNYHVEGDEAVFSGVVSSPKHACEKRRKVIVVGTDPVTETRVLGKHKTGPRGGFEVREPIPFGEDSAHAKLKRTRLDNGTKCKGARSEEINTSG